MAYNNLNLIRDRLSNPYECFKNNKLELDNQDLDYLIEAHEKLLDYYNQVHESVKIELETEKDLNCSFVETLKEDIEQIKEKSKILDTYLGVIGSYEFSLNKLHAENELYIQQLFDKLKEFAEKSKAIPEKLEKLRGLQQIGDELRNKTNALMAPAH